MKLETTSVTQTIPVGEAVALAVAVAEVAVTDSGPHHADAEEADGQEEDAHEGAAQDEDAHEEVEADEEL